MAISALRIGVLVVWKQDVEIRNKLSPLNSGKKRFTKTRKRIPRSFNRSRFHVAVGANPRNWPLAREELLPVTSQARLMFRILSHIRKGLITLAYLLPILGWECVA